MEKNKWTNKDLIRLHEVKSNRPNSTWTEIASELGIGKSSDACRKKYNRSNWDKVLSKKKNSKVDPIKRVGVWSQDEMLRLYTYLDAEKSYQYIAEKLGRSIPSVESKSQSTDWAAWHAANFNNNKEVEGESNYRENLIQQLVDSMVALSRHDYRRIKDMKKNYFLERINLNEKDLPISFGDIKYLAEKELDECGLGNIESLKLNKGTYIVLGDSHGKHTKRKMFSLIKNINKFLKASKIIHIGHLLDDDNDISFKWGDFDNLIVLSKGEELKIVHRKRNSHNFHYDVVRSEVILGDDLSIVNQDLISDYVKTPIRNLDNELFDGKMIVNCHRLEASSKASGDGFSHYIVSPGAICEKHIVRTIRQINFEDSKTVKVAYHEGFAKYRRQEQTSKYWDQGLLVVDVDKMGRHTITPCSIKEIGNEYYTSYFDKIISSKGIHEPDRKIFIHADMHSPKHDPGVLDLQEQVCKDYNPDVLVNIGDSFDSSTLSHHEMNKGHVIYGDFLQESAKTHHVMKRMASWAPEKHAIVGNHERFVQDFVKKFPQLSSILDFEFVCDLENLGYKVTQLKDVLKIGNAKFIHGDMVFFNQTGSKLEKASRTLGHNTFIGHIHYPSMRFGCCSVGFSGLMDQGYNEPEASAWIHGLGMCNQFKGESWPTTIAIFNHSISLNKKVYYPKNKDSWKLNKFKARIEYSIEE